MSFRLRHWAETGDYAEEPPAPPAPVRAAWRLENAPLAALVPIGILMGSLLALAFVARLLLLPLRQAGGSRRQAED